MFSGIWSKCYKIQPGVSPGAVISGRVANGSAFAVGSRRFPNLCFSLRGLRLRVCCLGWRKAKFWVLVVLQAAWGWELRPSGFVSGVPGLQVGSCISQEEVGEGQGRS